MRHFGPGGVTTVQFSLNVKGIVVNQAFKYYIEGLLSENNSDCDCDYVVPSNNTTWQLYVVIFTV